MFFKKNNSQNSEEFAPKRGIKKIDAIVTGAILGGVVASLYGVKKLKDKKSENFSDDSESKNQESASNSKKSLFSRIFQK